MTECARVFPRCVFFLAHPAEQSLRGEQRRLPSLRPVPHGRGYDGERVRERRRQPKSYGRGDASAAVNRQGCVGASPRGK